jgi:hypothetical protein
MDTHPSLRPDDLPPLRTQADLHRQWRMLMGPLGFSRRSLWLHLLDGESRSTPAILQIEDMPRLPRCRDVDGLVGLCRQLVDGTPGATVVFLLTRPGRTGITVEERSWARALHDVVRRAGLPGWPVHWANDVELGVCSPDDLAAAG